VREPVRDKIRFFFSPNVLWYALVLGLVAVLIFLGLLQYRSSRQVSDATTGQMRASLQGSLMDFRQGVERELTSLCREFQADSEIPRAVALQEYANRVDRWRRAAAHPSLVADVYVWRAINGDNPEFLQLNGKPAKIAATDWPAEYLPLRQRLQQMSPHLRGYRPTAAVTNAPRTPDHLPPAPAPPSFPWMIDESIPALVNPVLESEKSPLHGGGPVTVDWIVIRLNLEVLQHHIFPELAQRYFGKDSASTYRLAVIADRGSGSVIYSSDETFGRPGDESADAALNLFGPPISMLGTQRLPFERMFSFGGPPHPTHPGGSGKPESNPPRSNPENHEGGPPHIDPIHYVAGARGWTVLARHREGSVEAAVAASYRRNLIINFGVLLILATTMALIILTSQRARRLAQSQVDFVAGVSHELRTPLTGIVSAAQNIADGLVDNQERMARYGAAILNQAKQLSDLIEQILLFSATEKNRHRYRLQLVDVAEIIDASLKSTAGLGRYSGFTVQRKIQPDLPRVSADIRALTQCLQNLLVNAVKYSGSSRWIGVEASITNDAHWEREVTIAVEDRGLGIERQELKHIFEPFYRSPAVTAAQIHGSGLGLPLAKNMIEAMGGTITLTSEPRKGSKFTIHLPIPDGRDHSSLLATAEEDSSSQENEHKNSDR
jgi:signal transduction histidine kinase